MRNGNRAVKKLVAGLTGLLAVAIVAEVGGRIIVDEDFVRDRLGQALGGGHSTRVSVEEVSFSVLARRLEASNVLLGRADLGTVSSPRVVLTGLPLLTLATGGASPEVGTATVVRPFAYYHPGEESSAGGPGNQGAAADDARRGDAGEPGGENPALRVGELRIERATVLAWRVDPARGPRRVLVRDVDVDGRNLGFDRTGRLTGPRDGLAWRTGSFTRIRADGLTRLSFDSMRASAPDSTFRFSGLRMEPTLPDPEFFRRLDTGEDRIRAELPRIRGRGFDFAIWPRGGFSVRSVQLDSVDIDVYTNRRLPSGPSGPSGDPWLPHTLVEAFGGRLRIDSVQVRGRIEYRELPEREVADPARIAFENFNGRILDISNASGGGPIELTSTMDVFGGPAEMRIEIPLGLHRMLMHMEGRVENVDLKRINSLTVPLEGIQVQDGRLEALRFDIEVDGPSAGGTVWAAYRDLDVQMVDRRSGEGGLLDDIRSFVTNTFVLRSGNMPDEESGEEAVPGRVDYYVEPDDPFFTRVWAPIRTGLLAVAKQ